MKIMLLKMANFSSKTMEGRKQWNDILKMLKRGWGAVNLEIYIQNSFQK